MQLCESHKFTHAFPPTGSFGSLVIYCTRCGMTRSEILLGETIHAKESAF